MGTTRHHAALIAGVVIGLVACQPKEEPKPLPPLVTTTVPAPPYTGTRPDTYNENATDSDLEAACEDYWNDIENPDYEDWELAEEC